MANISVKIYVPVKIGGWRNYSLWTACLRQAFMSRLPFKLCIRRTLCHLTRRHYGSMRHHCYHCPRPLFCITHNPGSIFDSLLHHKILPLGIFTQVSRDHTTHKHITYFTIFLHL